jgi:hypothetical protein
MNRLTWVFCAKKLARASYSVLPALNIFFSAFGAALNVAVDDVLQGLQVTQCAADMHFMLRVDQNPGNQQRKLIERTVRPGRKIQKSITAPKSVRNATRKLNIPA